MLEQTHFFSQVYRPSKTSAEFVALKVMKIIKTVLNILEKFHLGGIISDGTRTKLCENMTFIKYGNLRQAFSHISFDHKDLNPGV